MVAVMNNKLSERILLSAFVAVGYIGTAISAVSAQPIAETRDITGTQVVELDNDQFLIQGGSTSSDGANLFHGFEQFDLSSQQTATFLNSNAVNNIFSRISGGQLSFIDGTIQTLQGNPNLYFVNPAGIIFGENATLNVLGDFVASSATAIGFDRAPQQQRP